MNKIIRRIKKHSSESATPKLPADNGYRSFLYRGLYRSVFLTLSALSLFSFAARADCPQAALIEEKKGMDEAVRAYTDCAIRENDDASQRRLAQYYQNSSQPNSQVKKLLFYHLSAENGNAHAQVALAKLLLELDSNDESRERLQSYLRQIKIAMEDKSVSFKGEILHPYILLTLAAEGADQKWYYPTKDKFDSEAKILLQNYKPQENKIPDLLRQGSQWKQRKMSDAAKEVMTPADYARFMETISPQNGKADKFSRQRAISDLQDKIQAYLTN